MGCLLAGAPGDTHAQSPESPAAGCTATRASPAHPCPRPRPAHGAQLRSQVRRAQLSRFGGLGMGDDRPRVPRGSPARQVAGSSRRVVIVYWPLALRVTLSKPVKSLYIVLCQQLHIPMIAFFLRHSRLRGSSAPFSVHLGNPPRGRAAPKHRRERAARQPSNRRGRDGHRPAAGGHHQKARL